MRYQVYGSSSSVDTDVVFFIDEMPTTILKKQHLCHSLCGDLQEQTPYSNRLNGNLAVIQNGCLKSVYKGTIDELNNALYYTFHLHTQPIKENQILKLLKRDIDLKFIRCARMILSSLTRTIYRSEVKSALRSDMNARIEVLNKIKLPQISETDKGYSLVDLKKLLAFQMGQTMALHNGKELYTKEDIFHSYPKLTPYLKREYGTEMEALQEQLSLFIINLEERVKWMKQTEEYQIAAY